jgi:phosphoribosylformylglycinamidine synthase
VGKVNLEDERAIQNLISKAIRDRLIKSAHDVSEGGLAVALAECCFSNIHRKSIGAEVVIPSHLEVCKDLFAEVSSRVLLTSHNVEELQKRAEMAGLKCFNLGRVGGKRLILNYENVRVVDAPVDELETTWRQGLTKLLS